MKARIVLLTLFFAVQGMAQTFDFFKVQSVKYVDALPSRGADIFRKTFKQDANGRMVFLPYLEVTVRTEEGVRFDKVYVKVYYYDKDKVLIEKSEEPTPVLRGSANPQAMPVFFEKNKTETLYFIVPANVLSRTGWRAVAVFGDQQAAAASVWPSGLAETYFFPERAHLEKPNRSRREVVADPVVEYVVKTRNTQQPQITLFMRPPIGMTDVSGADGVLAICLLANRVEDIRRQLQTADSKDDVGGILRFAEKRNLVILCWGSSPLWDPGKNWDELDRETAKRTSDLFDDVAAAWARGVDDLSRRYGIPNKEFLLWGFSASAQYAKRLALRKPEYFLAAHIHISSSFDKPTPDAAQVLWCLTTGENDGGYERSLRFLTECRKMGYPILYKAIPGLGHSSHSTTDRLGAVFFDYALGLREERRGYEAFFGGTQRMVQNLRPWPISFREAEFVGDVVNQQLFRTTDEEAYVPEAFRIDIPTRLLAEAWEKEK